MVTKRFQNIVAESRMALPITAAYACIMCVAGGLISSHLWIQFGLLAVTSFLMMELNNTNALIRIYSRMVSCSFLVLAVMSHFLFVDIRCGVVQACFVAFYLFLFSAYQDKRAVGKVFYAFLMLGVASLVFVQIFYFVPVIWVLLCTNIMAGSFRVLLSSVFGLIVPYWFAAAYYLYTDNIDALLSNLCSIIQFGDIAWCPGLQTIHIVTFVFVAIIALIGIVHFRLNNYKDKICTRMLFEIFTFMILFTILFAVLQPQHLDFLLAMLIVSTAPMIGHYLALTHTMVTNISFYVMLVFVLVLTFCNIWMPF